MVPILMLLPWPLSRLVNIEIPIATDHDPSIRVASSGTVAVTAEGMFGKGHNGWGITTIPITLSLVVGSIIWKPVVIDGRIEPREILDPTVMFDHNIVNGAPAPRFVSLLLEMIESGTGLDALQVMR